MNPFAVLGLPPRFDVDLPALAKTHRELSRALHPDRYADAGPTERREALSRAVEVNEAHRIVKDPLRRAEALFALGGVATGENHEPKPSPVLLMAVMELREALVDARGARDAAAVERLAVDVAARAAQTEAELAAGFRAVFGSAGAASSQDAPAPTPSAPNRDALAPLVPKLGELRFYRRFLDEVSAVEDLLAETAAPRGTSDPGAAAAG